MNDDSREYYCAKHPSERLSVLSSTTSFSPRVEKVFLNHCQVCVDEARQGGKAEVRDELSAEIRRLKEQVDELTSDKDMLDEIIEKGW